MELKIRIDGVEIELPEYNVKWWKNMASTEEFRKYVDELERKHGITDCVYRECIEEFKNIKLSELNKEHEIRIIKPFLLTWGVMGRVLGNAGIRPICEKLKDINEKIKLLRNEDLFSVNLDEIRGLVIELFNEIREIKFKSNKKKEKEVGPTATSKVLHLTCPNLFIMWDFAIRNKYNGDGKGYFEFLSEMKKMGEELESTIKDLKQKYGKSPAKIIDEYNWMKAHGKNKL